MDETQEKRMIGNTGYEVRQAFRIGGKEILLAENQNAEDGMMHMVCQYIDNGLIAEYSLGIKSDDYLETVQDFTGRINAEVEKIQSERDAQGLPAELFTAADCYPHDYAESIEGKVVAIKSSVLSPEYRRGDVQLVYAVRGNGVAANPRGNAVYCYQLNDGKHTRFERYDVLGIIRPEAMPEWAKESLVRIKSEMDRPAETKEFAANYEIIDRIEVGQKVYALGFCERAAQPYGTWQGYKRSAGNFDYGHYFNDKDEAKTDMHKRAGEEQKRLDAKKCSDGAR